jgi:hypothetical protein
MMAANANTGMYFISILEIVLAINIKGMGTWIYRNQRNENFFDFALARPNGRLISRVNAKRIRIV